MGSESVGSSTPHLEPNPVQEPSSGPKNIPGSQRRQTDICFSCQKQGHWAKDCPDKSKKKSGPISARPTAVDGQAIPAKYCPCGGGPCLVLTSKTEKNPGRNFYKCPGKTGMRCNFFMWCDDASFDQGYDVPESAYPICPCGAGKCSPITVKKEGKTKGRKFFACPVKKGQGACAFFQWMDSPGNTMSNDHLDSKPVSSPQLTLEGQEDEKITDDTKDGNGHKLEVIVSLESTEKASELPLSEGLDSGVDSWSEGREREIKFLQISRTCNTSYNNKTLPEGMRCNFFSRCDDASSDQGYDVPESSNPICPCGAGKCSPITVQKEGETKGQKFFACPVKKGQGACNFFQQLDSPGNSTSNGHPDDSKHFSAPQLTLEGQEDAKITDEDPKDGNGRKLEAISSSESGEKASESPLFKVLDSGVDDALHPPIGNLRLSEDNRLLLLQNLGNESL